MVIFFGNLTLDFERFGAAVEQGSSSVPAAAATFRTAAGKDASYLVYTGTFIFDCPFIAQRLYLSGVGVCACTQVIRLQRLPDLIKSQIRVYARIRLYW